MATQTPKEHEHKKQEKKKGKSDPDFHLGWGMCEKEEHKEIFYHSLFAKKPPAKMKSLFLEHNSHIKQNIKTGDLFIVMNKEPTKKPDIEKLHKLKEQVLAAYYGLEGLNEDQRKNFIKKLPLMDWIAINQHKKTSKGMYKIYPFMERMSDDLAFLSNSLTYLIENKVKQNLNKINELYVKFASDYFKTRKISNDFYLERKPLMKQADSILNKLILEKIGFKKSTKIERELGLSTKSTISNIDSILDKGEATQLLGSRIRALSEISKGLSYTGNIAAVLDGVNRARTSWEAIESNDKTEKKFKVLTKQIGGGVFLYKTGAKSLTATSKLAEEITSKIASALEDYSEDVFLGLSLGAAAEVSVDVIAILSVGAITYYAAEPVENAFDTITDNMIDAGVNVYDSTEKAIQKIIKGK
jgi:hypothetical protein